MEAAHLRDGNGASKFSRLRLWTKPLDLMHAEYLQRESACGTVTGDPTAHGYSATCTLMLLIGTNSRAEFADAGSARHCELRVLRRRADESECAVS
jgi:hypothetical protein